MTSDKWSLVKLAQKEHEMEEEKAYFTRILYTKGLSESKRGFVLHLSMTRIERLESEIKQLCRVS